MDGKVQYINNSLIKFSQGIVDVPVDKGEFKKFLEKADEVLRPLRQMILELLKDDQQNFETKSLLETYHLVIDTLHVLENNRKVIGFTVGDINFDDSGEFMVA